jgi:hypothetical protein
MITITFSNGDILTPANGYEMTEEERLKVVKVDVDAESIPMNLCKGCVNLKTLTLSENIKTIGAGAFLECSALEGHLNLPSAIKKIGEFAFHKCSSLRGNLIISDNCAHIGPSAFGGCTGFDGYLYFPSGSLAFHPWDKKKELGRHFSDTTMTCLRLEDILTLDEKIGFLIRQLVISELEES